MPLPPYFNGKQATIAAITAAVVRTMRQENGQSQEELAALLKRSRGQIATRERNTLRGRNGWTIEDIFKLDLAWSLPVGTVAQRCAKAYQRLRRSLVINDSRSATASISVQQLQYALAFEDSDDDL